jgi:hypothetical protein
MIYEQQTITMVFGAIITISGLVLLFRNRQGNTKDVKNIQENKIEILGLKLETATPGLAVFLVGCTIFAMPFIIQLTTKKSLSTSYIKRYPASSISNHGIKLLSLSQEGDKKPLAVGDMINIKFTLKNFSKKPIKFNETFIAARNPQKINQDFGYSNQNIVIKEGEAITINGSKELDVSGYWKFWPCYNIVNNESSENYCPDEWESFLIKVVK